MKNNDILNKSNIEAINNIKHFFELLNLNPEAFNHLYNIDTSIEIFENPGEIAYYYHDPNNESDSNRISISEKYLNDTKNKLRDQSKIVDEVSITLIHEIMHANRCISIFNVKDYFENMPYEYGNNGNEKLRNKKNALEEMVTETLAYIIHFNKDKKVFNLNETINEINAYLIKNNKLLLRGGIILINEYREQLIYSFIMSSYEETYKDEIINEIISNEELLNNINELYYDKNGKMINNMKSSIKKGR